MPEAATQTTIPEGEATFVDRIRLYRREIIAAAVILVGVMLVYGIATSIQQQAEDRAQAAFFKVEFDNANTPSLDLAKEMAAARVKHAGTKAVAYAHLRELNEYLQRNDYEKADASAREFLKEFPDHMFAPEVKLNRAKILMYKGDTAGATAIITGLKGLGLSWLEPQLKLTEAQCLELKAEEAKGTQNYQKQLEKIRDMYTDIKTFGQNRGWPAHIISQAEFALIIMRDRIAGREPSMPPEKPKAPTASVPLFPGLKPEAKPGVATVTDPEEKKDEVKEKPEKEPVKKAETKDKVEPKDK